MKLRILLPIIFCLFLSGCSVSGQLPKFPDLPKGIDEPCQNLILIPDNTTKFSEVLNIITSNYGLYNECQIKNYTFLEWYKEQRKIYLEIKQ